MQMGLSAYGLPQCSPPLPLPSKNFQACHICEDLTWHEKMIFDPILQAMQIFDVDTIHYFFEKSTKEGFERLDSLAELGYIEGYTEEQKEEFLRYYPDKLILGPGDERIKENLIPMALRVANQLEQTNLRTSTDIQLLFQNGFEHQKAVMFAVLLTHGCDPQTLVLSGALTAGQLEAILTMRPDAANCHLEKVTALHVAVGSGIEPKEKVDLLMKHGADPNVCSEREDFKVGTPLHRMIDLGNSALATYFIKTYKDRIDPDLRDGTGATPLILAAKTLQFDVLSELIANFYGRIDLDAQDQYGRTALSYVALMGDLKMVQCLVYAGASIEIADKAGQRPEDHAASIKEGVVRALLIKAGVHPDRDENASANAITDPAGGDIFFATDPSGTEFRPVLCTRDNMYNPEVSGVIKNAHCEGVSAKYVQIKFDQQRRKLKGRSLIAKLNDERPKVREFLIQNRKEPELEKERIEREALKCEKLREKRRKQRARKKQTKPPEPQVGVVK